MQFGSSTDRLTPTDYDGDKRVDFAVYRNGEWYVQRSQLGLTAFGFGEASDIPIANDFEL